MLIYLLITGTTLSIDAVRSDPDEVAPLLFSVLALVNTQLSIVIEINLRSRFLHHLCVLVRIRARRQEDSNEQM